MKRPALALKVFTLTLLFVALNAHAQTRMDERGVAARPVSELPAKLKRWALVIGVDQYKDRQIGQLGGAVNDAHTLADALVRYSGFPPDQVIMLATDQPEERQPTRVNILRRLSNLAAVVPKDALLLVSFAGHGIERNGQAFLLPSDAQIGEDIVFLEETAISVSRMKERIKATGVGQVLFLLDACRNDPGGRADAPNLMSSAYTKFNFDVRNGEVEAFATIYATDVGQRAYEYSEKRQGYFTWALVEGLRGGAANERGEVTLAGLIKFVQETVPKRIGIDLGAGKMQRPFAIVEGYKAEGLVLAATGTEGVVATTGSAERPLPSSAPATPSPAFELSYWESIKESNNPQDFKAYLRQYPRGVFASLARNRLDVFEPPHKRPDPGDAASAPDNKQAANVKDSTDTVWQRRQLSLMALDIPIDVNDITDTVWQGSLFAGGRQEGFLRMTFLKGNIFQEQVIGLDRSEGILLTGTWTQRGDQVSVEIPKSKSASRGLNGTLTLKGNMLEGVRVLHGGPYTDKPLPITLEFSKSLAAAAADASALPPVTDLTDTTWKGPAYNQMNVLEAYVRLTFLKGGIMQEQYVLLNGSVTTPLTGTWAQSGDLVKMEIAKTKMIRGVSGVFTLKGNVLEGTRLVHGGPLTDHPLPITLQRTQ
jgi:hypothetical protein